MECTLIILDEIRLDKNDILVDLNTKVKFTVKKKKENNYKINFLLIKKYVKKKEIEQHLTGY